MFLLDAHVVDIVPGFWEWLDRAHQQGLICSIEAVKHELTKHQDELAEWVQRSSSFFKPLDTQTTKHFPTISTWANSPEHQYRQSAIAGFTANHANFLLVAYAKEHGCTVVTHEKARPKSQ